MADEIKPGWFCRAEVARIFDTTVRNFDATYRRWFPASAVRTIDGRPYFHVGPVIKPLFEAQNRKPEPESDPLLVGGDSPALEEYRKHRARREKVQADLAERGAVMVDQIGPPLMQLSGTLRRAGETLARRWGNDAAAVLNEAVSQWEDSLETLLSNESDPPAVEADSADHPHAPAADDARVR